MNTHYEKIKIELKKQPKVWLITGVAGFIGSNLLEVLLKLDQTIVGLDNFATGHQYNLDEVQESVTKKQWSRFKMLEGDICNFEDCQQATKSVDYVLHQAALGSVPRSIEDPISTNQANISGFLNMLVASRNSNVLSFTYAASSSTYGDHPVLPKVEKNIGKPLSPYAVTKVVNELYADVFARTYAFKTIGLRYFNVFGRRQDPNGAYAPVIPKWIAAMLSGDKVYINGDGETSRDFCFIDNAIQMNILAATAPNIVRNEVYNVAVGDSTSLNQLFNELKKQVELQKNIKSFVKPVYRDFRIGDIKHSLADISKGVNNLKYVPCYRIEEGLNVTVKWYINRFS